MIAWHMELRCGKVRGQGRPRHGKGRTYKAAADRAWERAIRDAFAAQNPGVRPTLGPATVTVTVQRRLPMDERKQRPDLQKPDCDNVLKAVLDALTGLAWADDKQVVAARVDKLPRVSMDCDLLRVTVSQLDEGEACPMAMEERADYAVWQVRESLKGCLDEVCMLACMEPCPVDLKAAVDLRTRIEQAIRLTDKL